MPANGCMRISQQIDGSCCHSWYTANTWKIASLECIVHVHEGERWMVMSESDKE